MTVWQQVRSGYDAQIFRHIAQTQIGAKGAGINVIISAKPMVDDVIVLRAVHNTLLTYTNIQRFDTCPVAG